MNYQKYSNVGYYENINRERGKIPNTAHNVEDSNMF